jgi:glucose/arabinose dehydrogenase
MAMRPLLWLIAIALPLLSSGCRESGGAADSGGHISLAEAFPGLIFDQPLALVQPPGDDRWYLAEKGGRIFTFTGTQSPPALFADLRDHVDSGPMEAGLLGIAFHPRYQENRQAFLSYTAPGTGGAALLSRISRFSVTAEGSLDLPSEEVLLELPQPFGNHNGGQILFGPDGFLYIGFGDGGSGGDPRGNGQNPQTLLGAILRIDVDGVAPYAIPPDNPFVQGGGAPEIFAWGLRNPWRFSFDRQTGILWAADVGQNAWEEVNIVTKGGNYGWNFREGAHCFQPPVGCPTEGLIDPATEYPNAGGDCSVTGGYVYRGKRVPSLQGTYLFADFCSGKIWGLPLAADGRPAGPHRLLHECPLRISSFAEGDDGGGYLLEFSAGALPRIV